LWAPRDARGRCSRAARDEAWRMDMTLLLHKPIDYGSVAADTSFKLAVIAHAATALVAPVAGVVAMCATKGRKLHVRAGIVFVWAMVATAATGVLIDGVRLFVRYQHNHTGVDGMALPSTIPARLAFLFAGFGVVYLALLAGRRAVLHVRTRPAGPATWIVPAAFVAAALALTAYYVARLDPWSGALWMIWTFVAAVVVAAGLRRRQATDAEAGIARHRFAMLFLFAFAIWGAQQGFGPAIAVAIKGTAGPAKLYTGDQPGGFSLRFAIYFALWSPWFIGALFAARRFARRRAAKLATRAAP
jgi:hypothetical protein